MKYLFYVSILFFCSITYAKSIELSRKSINFPIGKVQKQISNSLNFRSNHLSRPIALRSRNDENLHGIWNFEHQNATLWITTGTTQTFPNPSQTQGFEPFEGNISINGSSENSLNYVSIYTYFYYDGIQIFLGNNPLIDIEGFDYFANGNISEDVILPYYFLEYSAAPSYNFFGAELLIIDTLDGELFENWYGIENSDDPLEFDAESMRITLNEMVFGNNDSIFYTLSGSLSPNNIDIEASVETQITAPLLTPNLGPVSENESMQWQLNSDGTGYQIISGENYYDSWIDTSAISWGTSDDSLSISLYDEDEDYYETINLLYDVENDSLYLSMELNYCDGMEAYYYIDCYEMFSTLLNIDDIQEVNVKLDVVMSFYETGLVNLDPSVIQSEIPSSFSLHQNYPNPFNPTTTLQYDLPTDVLVNITIYDLLGNVINQLVNEAQNSGYKSIQWDATNYQGQPVSAGVYIYRIEAGDFRQTKKMILLK
tara:strand:- start:140 stop:1591 length:1452 start_codon:yes stop_codon:yes gene_type:complete